MGGAIGSGYTNSSNSSTLCNLLSVELSGGVPEACPSHLNFVNTIRFRDSKKPLVPITAAENKTSNCWPTIPKSNTLSLVPTSYGGQFPATPSLGEDNGPLITTILTVFYPITSANGTIPLANVLQQPEAHLTCLKPIDEAGAIDAFTAMAGDTASGGLKMSGAGGVGLLVPGLVVLFWFLGL
ncbi:hypothetical protein MMC31_007037 [Peltigera leucophlebia]|nr:hypothetical protein [Peltigera leucophlebia]